MKNKYFLLLLNLLFFCSLIQAQVANYSFKAEMGKFIPNSGDAKVISTWFWGGNPSPNEHDVSSKLSPAIPIDFNFVYGGRVYNEFKISSYGYITFDTNQTRGWTSDNADVNKDNHPSYGEYRPFIAPLWGGSNSISTGISRVSYELSGEIPNRILTIEWLNWNWCSVDDYNSSENTVPTMSYQIKLY